MPYPAHSSTPSSNSSGLGHEAWFEYPVRAQPHHTDYAGIVWHGSYITWMEEARVECLRQCGVEFADLVTMGCDLPVVDMAIRYHRALRMGMAAVVKTRVSPPNGVRLNWDYQICDPDQQELYITAQVTLVPVDRQKGKIMRRLPAPISDMLSQLW